MRFVLKPIKQMKKQNKMNRKGAVSGGMIILLLVVAVFAYTQNFLGFKDLINPTPAPGTPGAPAAAGKCPSSGLTEVTINAQEALASTATNANVSYYIYDDGTLVKEGDTGSDGTVSIDVACAAGKTYSAVILNEKLLTGFYPQEFTIEASDATFTKNLKVYEFGQVNVASVVSSADPAGGANFSAGTGKTCGFTVTFSNNESASGYDKPLIMVLANSSAVTDITMDGVTEVPSKKPQRITTPGGLQYWIFEYPSMVKSTDAAIKVSGKVQFTSSMSVKSTAKNENMSVVIVDQSTYRTSQYKTLSLKDGFVTAAENLETQALVGAPDSNRATSGYKASYC